MRKKLRRHLIPLVILTLLSFFVCLPLLRHPFSFLADDYDGALITWIMTWTARSLTENPAQLYNAPILYPLTATYTFSDPLISGALLGLPFWLLTKEPVIFSTVNYVLAVWQTTLFSYLLLKDVTNSRGSSLAGALLISFTSLHFTYYLQLHTFMIQGIPLGLWAWWRFSRTLHRRWLAVWSVAFLFQMLNSPLTGYLFLAAHGLFIFDPQTWHTLKTKWRWCLLVLLLSGCFTILFYYPYLHAAKIYQSTRSIRDAAHFSLSINTWWQSGGVRQLTCIVAIVLAVLGLASKQGRQLLKTQPLVKGSLLVAILAFCAALGPVLKWSGQTFKIPFAIPLPYTLFYYLVPGMNAFRTPERWLLLSGLMAVVLVVLLWRKRPVLLLSFALILLLIEQPWQRLPIAFASTANRPAVYQWLDANQVQTALFIPTYVYDSEPNGARQETHRMLQLIGNVHVTKLVNGYTGYAPQVTMDGLKAYNQQFPQPAFWHRVEQEKIDAVVVELDQLTSEQRVLLKTGVKKPAFENDTTMVFLLSFFP